MAKPSKRQRTAQLLNELRPCRAGYAYDQWFELVKLLAPSNISTRASFLAACHGATKPKGDPCDPLRAGH